MARAHVVVIDNYDSFTWNLVQYLEELGARCDVRRNDETTPDAVLRAVPQGVVISPGPGAPKDAGVTLAVIAAAAGRVPLLGVCLGHQAIASHFGAVVRRAKSPRHGRSSLVSHDGRGVFAGLPSPLACGRYHSLALDAASFPGDLLQTAVAEDGEVMGIRHRALPVEGIQFHPESILSEHGHALLHNWLRSL